jgi:hypothetical protein
MLCEQYTYTIIFPDPSCFAPPLNVPFSLPAWKCTIHVDAITQVPHTQGHHRVTHIPHTEGHPGETNVPHTQGPSQGLLILPIQRAITGGTHVPHAEGHHSGGPASIPVFHLRIKEDFIVNLGEAALERGCHLGIPVAIRVARVKQRRLCKSKKSNLLHRRMAWSFLRTRCRNTHTWVRTTCLLSLSQCAPDRFSP